MKPEPEPERVTVTIQLPRIELYSNLLPAAEADRVIAVQAEHLERQWRQVIIDALRPETGSAAEHLAGRVIAALSERLSMWPAPGITSSKPGQSE